MAEAPRTSRRSYPNLHNLSLAPLSAKYPLDASAPPSPDTAHTPRTSYIAQRSAPTTPGILSLSQGRSNSRNGRRAKPIYAYDEYFTSTHPVGDIPKAKSTTALLPGVNFVDQPKTRHHARKGTAPLPLRTRHHTASTDSEWYHRAGLAIASEARDSKGQSWLVRRESSTSLTIDDERPMALLSGEDLDSGADYFPKPFSPRISRAPSRLHSRVPSLAPSARQSRRNSRASSRVDLTMTPAPLPSALEIDLVEPDFVEGDESSGDEEEVARLARERGGGWMDRLIGWSLFAVDESGESEDDEGSVTMEEVWARRDGDARTRREGIVPIGGEDDGVVTSEPPEEGGGWQDAAWLLSVASKALF